MMTTIVCRGAADVARWCKVSPSVVSNWITRFPDKIPVPDAETWTEGNDKPVRGWLPERRPEWEAFAAERNHAVRDAKSAAARRTQRTAALIEQGVSAGRIDPIVAVGLLSELVGSPAPEEGT